MIKFLLYTSIFFLYTNKIKVSDDNISIIMFFSMLQKIFYSTHKISSKKNSTEIIMFLFSISKSIFSLFTLKKYT